MNRVLSLWVGRLAVRWSLGGARGVAATPRRLDGSGGLGGVRPSASAVVGPGVRRRTRRRRRLDVVPGRARASSRCRTARRRRCRSTRRWRTSRRATSRSASARPTCRCSPASATQRQSALKQRALALLVTEIQQLESLLHATDERVDGPAEAAPAPRRGLRRARERGVPREDRCRGRARRGQEDEPARGRQKQQSIANSRKTTMERSRKAAINYYSMLVDDYSGQPSTTFPQNPPPAYPAARRGLYYLAYEYEQANDTANARRSTSTSSRRRRTRSTSRTRTSRSASSSSTRRRATREVGARRAGVPEGHQVPAARQQGLRLRLVQARATSSGTRATSPHALDAFKKTIDFGTQFAQLPNATKLADSARKDIIPVYALAGRPDATPTTSSRTSAATRRGRTTRRSR